MNTTPTTHGLHREAEMWGGPPGECGVSCSCGVSYDGFDSVREASELLEQQHIAHMNTTTTHGRHREATTRPAWLWPALGVLAAVVLLIVLSACTGETTTSAEREANRLEAGLPAKLPSEPAVEEPNDWSDADIFELAMELQLGTLTAAETVEVCDGVDVFGMDVAVAAYRVGFEEEGDWLSEYDAILSDAIEELCS